jgi:hypothetical protein
MKIKLRRSRDVFALTGVTGTFKNKIKDISLFVRKFVIFPGNGISLVLEHLSCTGIQPRVTPDVSVVAKIWL